MYHVLLFAQILIAALVATPTLAAGTLGGTERDAPRHLYLVKNCESAGWGDVDNLKCFQDIDELNDSLWGVSPTPTAATPVIVDIGPGDFTGVINCPDGEGHVTFRGAGRDRTVIHGIPHGNGFSVSAVSATNCNALGFEDIRLEAESLSPLPYGVAVSWVGGGSSSWTDVDVQGSDYGWYDISCPNAVAGVLDRPLGVHYWWGSKVVGGQIAGYYAECGETWFYGSEIAGLASVMGAFKPEMCAVRVAHRAQFHMIGSAARVSTAGASISSGTVYGIRVGTPGGTAGGTLGNGEFHSHGGVISVNSSDTSGVAATGLQVEKYSGGNARAHTLETGFAVKALSPATALRLSGTGIFESPHLWEARIAPPAAGGSITGQDIYAETDCNDHPDLSCTGGSSPHLMVYKAACVPDPLPDPPPDPLPTPWFDTATGLCRVE